MYFLAFGSCKLVLAACPKEGKGGKEVIIIILIN